MGDLHPAPKTLLILILMFFSSTDFSHSLYAPFGIKHISSVLLFKIKISFPHWKYPIFKTEKHEIRKNMKE